MKLLPDDQEVAFIPAHLVGAGRAPPVQHDLLAGGQADANQAGGMAWRCTVADLYN